jgi:hypothetical protein
MYFIYVFHYHFGNDGLKLIALAGIQTSEITIY